MSKSTANAIDSSFAKAVIYARFSSHAQNEQSIEGQLRVCREYAEREGYMVVGEYIDRAISGRSDDRPDFQRMISDAKKKAFQYVIVYKLDRFTRNRYDSAIYKYKLRQCGVKVLSAMENIGDNPESIILEAVLEASAEYYSVDLSQKIKRGRRDSAAKGKFVGGGIPIGYKTIGGSLIVDEEQAPAIKFAFEQYAMGVPKTKIMQMLNEQGFRNKAGKPYGATAFQSALQCEKYIGVLEQSGVRIEDACPALIDKEIFYKVQDRIKQNRHQGKGNKAIVEYFLRGKLFCGSCSAAMLGVSGKGRHGEQHYYYSCGERRRTHLCKKNHEKKDFVEWYIVEQTVEYVLTPGRMEEIARRIVEQYDNEFNGGKVKDLERRIKKLERDIDKTVDAIVEATSKAARVRLSEKVDLLEAQKADVEIDLAKLRIASGIRYTEEDICIWIKQFCSGDLMDEDFRRRIIDVFINSVFLCDDRATIIYNIKGGKQVSYIDVMDATQKAESEADLEGFYDGSYDKQLTPPNYANPNSLFFVKHTFGFILIVGDVD